MFHNSPHDKTLIMGVLNVTPDSFYDGGHFFEPAAAVHHARALVADGADMLDIGGESSRPGSEPVSPNDEWARVEPVLAALQGEDLRISIDTYHAETARRAIALGASMVNDITALRGDDAMAAVVAESSAECVLMHMLGTPQTMQQNPRYNDVVDDICAFFEERLAFAVRQGIAEEKLWLDPGFGFGKSPKHNLELLRRLRDFTRFGRPVLVGTSNKSTIGHVLGGDMAHRRDGTAATVAIAIMNGAAAVRVHDVAAMARVARMTDAVIGTERPNG